MQHSGSFAVVKLAVKKATGEKVAVKIIEKNPANPKQRDTVENEIYCWLRLDHKNCVNLHEVYETPEHYYLFQELYRLHSVRSFASSCSLFLFWFLFLNFHFIFLLFLSSSSFLSLFPSFFSLLFFLLLHSFSFSLVKHSLSLFRWLFSASFTFPCCPSSSTKCSPHDAHTHDTV